MTNVLEVLLLQNSEEESSHGGVIVVSRHDGGVLLAQLLDKRREGGIGMRRAFSIRSAQRSVRRLGTALEYKNSLNRWS